MNARVYEFDGKSVIFKKKFSNNKILGELSYSLSVTTALFGCSLFTLFHHSFLFSSLF